MSIDDFETIYRRYAEHCIAAGIVPLTEQATREQVAEWDRLLTDLLATEPSCAALVVSCAELGSITPQARR